MYVWVKFTMKGLQRGSEAEISLREGRNSSKIKAGTEQGHWSIHAFWSTRVVWRPGPDYDRHVGHRQHCWRFVDFLAQSCERIFEVVWCETHSASRCRNVAGFVENFLLGWIIAHKSNR